jgi:hypothetical protein
MTSVPGSISLYSPSQIRKLRCDIRIQHVRKCGWTADPVLWPLHPLFKHYPHIEIHLSTAQLETKLFKAKAGLLRKT